MTETEVQSPAHAHDRVPIIIIEPDRVIMTGQLGVGKDFVAEHNNYTVFAFSDPMIEVAEHFLGTGDKDKEGVRRFLQKLGAWGRGVVNSEYPMTLKRGWITSELRKNGKQITGMGTKSLWEQFGLRESEIEERGRLGLNVDLGMFWIELLSDRVRSPESGERIAITSARFPNEVNYFYGQDHFVHRHVMCSTARRRWYMEQRGETIDPEADLDLTEQLAAELHEAAHFDEVDAAAFAVFAKDNYGGALAPELDKDILHDVLAGRSVVWNDDPDAMPPVLRQKIDDQAQKVQVS